MNPASEKDAHVLSQGLFRQEVIDAKRGEWLGSIIVAAPLSRWLLHRCRPTPTTSPSAAVASPWCRAVCHGGCAYGWIRMRAASARTTITGSCGGY